MVQQLNYRSFEELVQKYYEPSSSKEAMVDLLVPAGFDDEKDQEAYDALYDEDKSTLNTAFSNYRSGKRGIPPVFLRPYERPDVLERVIKYFATRLTRHFPLERRADLVRELYDVIDSDKSIAKEQKDHLQALSGVKSDEGLNLFLAETFVYAFKKRDPKPQKKDAFPPNNLPFWRDDYFVGRDSHLQHIQSKFRAGRNVIITQTITGLGGVGKTQLAFKYAYQQAPKYSAVCWIHADNDATIQDSIKKFLVSIEDPKAEASAVIMRGAFLAWFRKNKNWLLVFDNVDNFKTITPYLPQNNKAKGDILITTRLQQGLELIRNKEQIDIDVFSEKEAVSFLLRRTGRDDKDNALKLARRLGFLPLALEQAGAYIAAEYKETDFVGYIASLEKHGLSVFDKNNDIMDYSVPVTATWQISMQKIKRLGAEQLLNMIAYFAPDDIPIELFGDFAGCLPEPLQSDIQDGLEKREVIGDLSKYSLVKYEDHMLSIHRLLQEVIRDNIEGEDCLETCLRLFYHICVFEKKEGYQAFDYTVSHIQTSLNIAGNKSQLLIYPIDERISTIYTVLADFYTYLGAYEKAITLYSTLLDLCEKMDLSNNDEMASVYTDTCIQLGYIHCVIREYDPAKAFIMKGIKFAEASYGANSFNIALMYDMASQFYENGGDFESAMEWCKKSLNIKEKILEPDHHLALLTKSNMVHIYESLGQSQAAEALRQEVRQAWITIPMGSLEKEPHNYNNYVALCLAIGQYDDAIYWGGQLALASEKKHGFFHPETMDAIFDVGVSYRMKGEHLLALELFDKVLEYQLNELGVDQERTRQTMREMQFCKDSLMKSCPYYEPA